MNDDQRDDQQNGNEPDVEEKSQQIIHELVDSGRIDDMVNEPTVLIQLPE